MIHSVSVAVPRAECNSLGGSFKKDRAASAPKSPGAEAVKAVLTANFEFANPNAPSLLDMNRLALKDESEESVEQHKKAMRFFDDRKFEEAHHWFKMALRSNPNNASAVSDMGVLYFYQNNAAEAQRCFQKALDLNPNHAGSHFNMGLIYYHRCELELAKSEFQICLNCNPSHTAARQHLNEILFLDSASEGSPCEASRRSAENMHREVPLTLHPGSLSTSPTDSPGDTPSESRCESPTHNDDPASQSVKHHHRAMKLFSNGQLEQASQEFALALSLDPQNAPALSDLGVLHFYQQQPDEAEACFKKALALRPKHAGSHFNLGLICRNRGDMQSAQQHFQQCLDANPQHAAAMQHLAEVSVLAASPAAPVTPDARTPSSAKGKGMPRLQKMGSAQNMAQAVAPSGHQIVGANHDGGNWC